MTALAALALLAALLTAMPARADLLLSQVIVDFSAGDPPIQDVEIWNDGGDTLYVETTVFRVTRPGLSPDGRERVLDPEAGGLLASPQRFVLGPGERRLLRIVLTRPPGGEERVYRVAVTPRIAGVEGDASGVKILIAYEMLVFVRPAEPVYEMAVRREGSTLVATNRGNTNVSLARVEQCRGDGDCTEVGGVRVYPGGTQRLDLPAAAATRVTFTAGERAWTDTY